MSDVEALRPAVEAVVLAAQGVASGAMCGLIWFVQVVHYPLFARITGDASGEHADENQRRTSWVVLPFMLVEAATATAIAISPPAAVGREAALVGVALLLALWISTLAVQVPLHARLSREGHQRAVVDALVRSNWFRTAAWTARAVLAAWMLRAAA